MDIAELLNNRVEEVAAFSTLLFRKRPREDDENTYLCPEGRRIVCYRRPSSANVPLSDVVRLAKSRMRRTERFARLAVGEGSTSYRMPKVSTKNGKKRLLTYAQWCLLLKRRRRFALRRRPSACRRIRRRTIALRQGKMQRPLCCCGESPEAASNSWLESSSVGKRTAVLWLPSHLQLCRRFHYSVVKRRVNGCSVAGDGSSSHLVTVRLAVPTRSQRKQHRVLQRWVARLSSSTTALKSPRRPMSKPMAVPPPVCFAAERSHMCVWTIQLNGTEHNLSVEMVMDFLMMRTNGTPRVASYTKDFAYANCGSVPVDETWRRWENGVFYGTMWSYERKLEKVDLPKPHTGLDDSAATPLVVPVVLLRDNRENRAAYILVAPVPVYFGPRACRNLSIRLVSYWNPCGAPTALGSVLELWCCADAVKTHNADLASSGSGSLSAAWAQQRVDAAEVRGRTVGGGSSRTPGEKQQGVKVSPGSPHLTTTETMSVCVFPSFSPTLETVDHGTYPIHSCVMTVLVLSGKPPYHLERGGATRCLVWQYRKRHFQFTRHVFFSLTSATAAAWRATRSCVDRTSLAFRQCKARGYARTVRMIGEDEREVLLRLAGCAAISDVGGSNAAFQKSRMARLCCTPSNAHQRVLLKIALKGGREHQVEGSALLLLYPGAPAELVHIGTITSASFFSMRFGCRVAYAWVWESSGWELMQRHIQHGRSMAPCDHHSESSGKPAGIQKGAAERGAKDSGMCCFLSGSEKLPRLLPLLSKSPVRVEGCSTPLCRTRRRRCQRGNEAVASAPSALKCPAEWRALEVALCDRDLCLPVEVVLLGAAPSFSQPQTDCNMR
ncbi:hypothetical protein DQ04_00681040 [Trypanosoma grayi]|uniref:hypothetical protein n=1 Tax=Trypanosoma grayi TaxID=71804 RepID=UPI0004F49302|nr:hypothetical protein DQ04_00681040 [Trypanosoma grayi]KEG13980.1 hypothetical protein DQ04_00681040 [Trypanosoma grayi]